MARDINDIQRDIERTRNQLASTLDQLAERGKPANLVEDAKTSAAEKLKDPKVQAIVAGVTAVVVAGIAFSISRSRKRNKELKASRSTWKSASKTPSTHEKPLGSQPRGFFMPASRRRYRHSTPPTGYSSPPNRHSQKGCHQWCS